MSTKRAARLSTAQGGNILSGWFPYAGTVLAGKLIAWEFYDACKTMDYINELKTVIDPATQPTTCGLHWEDQLSIITISGKKFIELERDAVPEKVLERLDEPEAHWRNDEIGSYAKFKDRHGVTFVRDIGLISDSYFIELE